MTRRVLACLALALTTPAGAQSTSLQLLETARTLGVEVGAGTWLDGGYNRFGQGGFNPTFSARATVVQPAWRFAVFEGSAGVVSRVRFPGAYLTGVQDGAATTASFTPRAVADGRDPSRRVTVPVLGRAGLAISSEAGTLRVTGGGGRLFGTATNVATLHGTIANGGGRNRFTLSLDAWWYHLPVVGWDTPLVRPPRLNDPPNARRNLPARTILLHVGWETRLGGR